MVKKTSFKILKSLIFYIIGIYEENAYMDYSHHHKNAILKCSKLHQ